MRTLRVSLFPAICVVLTDIELVGHWKGKESLVPTTALGERFGKPVLPAGATTTSPLFSPYSPYSSHGEVQEGYPFMKPEHGVGIVVTEAR